MDVQKASDYINRNDHVTLREACRIAGVERFARGETELQLGFESANIWWAFQVSDEAYELVVELGKLGHGINTCSTLVYVVDGEAIPTTMKQAGSRPPKTGYKSPRWVPMVFRKQGVEEAIPVLGES